MRQSVAFIFTSRLKFVTQSRFLQSERSRQSINRIRNASSNDRSLAAGWCITALRIIFASPNLAAVGLSSFLDGMALIAFLLLLSSTMTDTSNTEFGFCSISTVITYLRTRFSKLPLRTRSLVRRTVNALYNYKFLEPPQPRFTQAIAQPPLIGFSTLPAQVGKFTPSR